MRLVTLSGAKAKNSAATTGSNPSSRRSLRMNSTPTATHAPTHALRVSVSDSATTRAGMTSAGQTRSRVPNTSRAPATPTTSISVARVGHVVAECASGSLAQAVEVEHPVLHDAIYRCSGTHGHDDVGCRRGAMAASQVVHGRHDQEKEELAIVDEAFERRDREDRRDQRDPRVGEQRDEERGRSRPCLVANHAGDPAEEQRAEQDLRRRDRQLHRSHERQQQYRRQPLEARRSGRLRHADRRGSHQCTTGILRSFAAGASSRSLRPIERNARSAAASTRSAPMLVRHLKSPGTHLRW